MPSEIILVVVGMALGLATAPLLRRWTFSASGASTAVLAIAVVGLIGGATLVAAQNGPPRIPPGLLNALNQVVPSAEITLIDVVKNDGTPVTFVKDNLPVDTDSNGVSISMTEDDKTIDVTTTIQKDMLPAGEPVQQVVPGFVIRAGTSSWVWDCKLVGGEVVCKKVQV